MPRDLSGPLILGTWGLGGNNRGADGPLGYGDVTDRQAEAVLDAAWEIGLRWVDTASSYGGGRAIRRLAGWQDSRGHRLQVIFKPGRPLREGRPVSSLSETSLRSEIEWAATHLGLPEVLLLKDPPPSAMIDGIGLEALQNVAAEYGDVPVGIATHRLDLAQHLGPGNGHILQIEYHGVNWRTATPVIASLATRGWRIWSMQPLAYGFLAHTYDETTVFASSDWRSRLPVETRRTLAQAAEAFFQRLAPAVSSGTSRAVQALAFCLANPDIERTIVGPKRIAHVPDIRRAADLAADARFCTALARMRNGV